MVHDRKRQDDRPGAVSRPVIVVAYLNLACVIIAGSLTDTRAWWVVAGVAIVSIVCVATLLLSHRRR